MSMNKKKGLRNIKYLHSTDIKGKLSHNWKKKVADSFAVQTKICEWIYSSVEKSKQTKCMHKKWKSNDNSSRECDIL